eukprot:2508769-Karenia_brevis.AAC.1
MWTLGASAGTEDFIRNCFAEEGKSNTWELSPNHVAANTLPACQPSVMQEGWSNSGGIAGSRP